MNLYESIKKNLYEHDDTLKQLIKDEFGFDIKYLDYNSTEFAKHGNLNEFIRRCLQEAKEIGLNVDEISFGYPGVGDNYVGNHESRISITDNAVDEGTLLRKELPAGETPLDTISNAVLGKPISIDDVGNIFTEKDDYSIQGVLSEYAALYYTGENRAEALELMQAIR